MLTTTKPLLEMTAADLMTTDLLLIPRYMSLPAAARLLCRHGVTGAPVVDDDGRCIGVLSAMDFVHWAEGRLPGYHEDHAAEDFCSSWQVDSPPTLPETTVAEYMSRRPVTVPATCKLPRIARIMLDEHIHRVVVTDEANRPEGIVTSIDILAAIARAGES